jgi:hypothetical protein
MQKLQHLYENTGWLELTETDDNIVVFLEKIPVEEFTVFLEEKDFEYTVMEDCVLVFDSFDELYEELEECELVIPTASFLLEASAKRKIVIRRGKRKVIFQCPPGQKKIGRRCQKRPTRELMKLKRRAKRAARKSRRKRSQANRRRKMSLKRRPHKAHHKHEK